MRLPSLAALLSTICLSAVGACTVGEPSVNVTDDGGIPNQHYYADVVIAIVKGGQVTSCLDGTAVPVCGQMAPPPSATCSDTSALGPPDDKFYVLGPLDRIDLALSCPIREVGAGPTGPSNDFIVRGRVEGGARPVVQVSNDASTYLDLNFWPQDPSGSYVPDAGFKLESVDPDLPLARYVRISEIAGKGQILIDAIDALPIGMPQ